MVSQRLKAFVKLGTFLREYSSGNLSTEGPEAALAEAWDEALALAEAQNGWYTRSNIMHALARWGTLLTEEHLSAWLKPYPLQQNRAKTVALVMAGNIPLVGFHDFLSCLITGNKVLVKCASNDQLLLPLAARYLTEADPNLGPAIQFTKATLQDYDAVIATGSDNSARYFEYYFGKKPHIIRKNRNGVAVLTGEESPEEIRALGTDIFTYFGLGCRNVSKLYVPKEYDFSRFFEPLESFQNISTHTKYAHNYDYNKAVYLMSDFPILDNGFLILKEDSSYSSPIGALFYETYDSAEKLEERLQEDASRIQCVVSSRNSTGTIPFGCTQQPSLTDYADGIDTVEFLLKT